MPNRSAAEANMVGRAAQEDAEQFLQDAGSEDDCFAYIRNDAQKFYDSVFIDVVDLTSKVLEVPPRLGDVLAETHMDNTFIVRITEEDTREETHADRERQGTVTACDAVNLWNTVVVLTLRGKDLMY